MKNMPNKHLKKWKFSNYFWNTCENGHIPGRKRTSLVQLEMMMMMIWCFSQDRGGDDQQEEMV
jgi:hypothetical protein